MKCQLVIVAGPEKGRTFPIEEGQTLAIGRGQASDTQINDAHMSRVHCRVQMDGGKATLFDAGSSSGTFVAGEKIAQHELKAGEMFQDHVVMRALAKDPRDRHQTPAELLRDLDRIGKFNNLDADWSDWVG